MRLPRWLRSAPPDAAPTVGEAAVLLGGVGLGLLTAVSLTLALFGVHRAWLAVLLTVGLTLVVALAAGRGRTPRPQWDATELVVGALLVAVTAALVFPGFHYGAKSRDPGVYVGHAFAIEREHTTNFPDPAFATATPLETEGNSPAMTTSEGTVDLRCCGTYTAMPPDPDRVDRILPSFFHAWPALLATSLGVAGRVGLFNTGPAFAVLSVLALFLAVRRGAGTLVAVLAAGLLTVDMMQVWQARYPTAEMATQFFFAMAVLGFAVGIQLRRGPPLAVAGFATGVAFLLRPDGLLPLLIGLGVIAGLVAVDRARWAVRPLLAGLAVTAPLGLYQAYDRASRYAKGKVPPLPLLLAVLIALGLGVLAVRWLRRRRPEIDDWVAGRSPEQWRRLAAAGVTGGLALVFLLAALRPWILGEAMGVGRSGDIVRKYDEANLRRLTWFMTPAAIPLATVGLYLLVRRRNTVALWGLLVPGLALTPLYLWNPRIAPHLMWWTRRYVPLVLVFLLVCAAAALAWLLTRSGRWRLLGFGAGIGLTAWMVVTGVSQSLELAGHDEWGGSLAIIDQLDAVAADEPSLFVWIDPGPQMQNFVATPLSHHGQPSLAIAGFEPEMIDRLHELYPDRRLLLVSGSRTVEGVDEVPLARVEGTISRWEDTLDRRPTEARVSEIGFWVIPA